MEPDTETKIDIDKFLQTGCPTLPGSCDHIASLKSDTLLEDYKLLYSFYVACVAENAHKRKAEDCKCSVESCKTQRKRVHACLCCIYFGCFEILEREFPHIYRHAHENSHVIAMDTDSGRVFCFECNDYKYDYDLEKIAHELNLMASRYRSNTTCTSYKWEPTAHEANFLLLDEFPIVYDSTKTAVKGFWNIQKDICSFITIIQTLIHAPVFRDYLLSTKHRCNYKKRKSLSLRKGHPWCSICEMTKIIKECFSGESKTVIIVDFLDFLHVRAKKYATNQWHDSCDVYETLINLLCEDCEGASSTGPKSPKIEPCNCLINSMFFLTYHTELTCNKCQKVTISAEQTVSTLCMLSTGEQISLTECLKKNLDSCSSYCSDCSQSGGKFRIVPKKLPYILSFSLEQFELQQKTRGKKKESFIQYKEFINLSPDNLTDVVNWWDGLKYPEYQYYLFSVVHLSSGHYTVYIRKDKNNWFYCDDTNVKPQPLEKVLAVKARMLFYHKQFI